MTQMFSGDCPPVDYPSRNADDSGLVISRETPRSPPQAFDNPQPRMAAKLNQSDYFNGSSSNGFECLNQSLSEFSFGVPKEFNVPGLKLPVRF